MKVLDGYPLDVVREVWIEEKIYGTELARLLRPYFAQRFIASRSAT